MTLIQNYDKSLSLAGRISQKKLPKNGTNGISGQYQFVMEMIIGMLRECSLEQLQEIGLVTITENKDSDDYYFEIRGKYPENEFEDEEE